MARPTASPLVRDHVPSKEEPLSSEPIVSPAQPAVECCTSCGAVLASDQRYCLECGVRRSVLAGNGLESLLTLASGDSAAPAKPTLGGAPVPGEPARTSATSAVIAGVGVLLLAMGVGVLIGRSSPSAKAAAQPQVISVAAPTGGSGAATGQSTTSGQASTPGSSTNGSKRPASKHGSSKSSETSTQAPAGGVGQTPGKPAPPSVAEKLKGSHGGSYEQKSKNLPNVISTG